MKLAVVQDWLTSYGGAEKCIEALCEVWPQLDIYTLIYCPKIFAGSVISQHKVVTSFAQRLPWSRTKFRHYFMLYPYAVEQFDLRGYDVVISFSAAFSHGILTDPDQVHICYKHTPMRYAWSGYQEYLTDPHIRGAGRRLLTRLILHRLRKWDYAAAQRPDVMLANSQEVRRRIRKYYRRDAQVIHPPVEIPREAAGVPEDPGDYFVNIGRLVSYKRVDLIVQAFVRMANKRLVIAGDGPELARLRKMAEGSSNIEILGFVDEARKLQLLSRARAFVFAAHEDFGIAPVEAQACGTPVIAYGRGGALETVVHGKTGVFYAEQSATGLLEAVTLFEQTERTLNRAAIREHARGFSKEVFQRQFRQVVEDAAASPERGAGPLLYNTGV